MRQDMMADEYSRDLVEPKDFQLYQPRALTYDEKKAAEAAFLGKPFNLAWSAAAAKVYAGIQSAMDKRPPAEAGDSEMTEECTVGGTAE